MPLSSEEMLKKTKNQKTGVMCEPVPVESLAPEGCI